MSLARSGLKGFQVHLGPNLNRDGSVFRVVDLELGCVREVPLETQYVALSYVWGQLPMFKLMTDNLNILMTPGILESIRKDLPKTIHDAIDFVKAVGARFLWVDALCLVQDDATDVSLGVNLMSSIYHDSLFTLVAGSGIHANSGLPGVQPNSRTGSQMIVDIAPGLRMTANHSINWHLSRSVYNERGWTCQELVLPRRAVIFINNTVYFRCQSANWSEETAADCCPCAAGDSWLDPDDFDISRIPAPIEGPEAAWWAYQKLGEDCSRRQLRFDGDALRAVAGIARPLAQCMDTCMLQGLPLRYLDNALLFMSSTGSMRRRPGFASYSSAGWAGKIMWPRENYSWYARNKTPDGGSRDGRDGDDEKDEERVPDLSAWMDAHTMVAWSVRTSDNKVYALFPFARFQRSFSSLQDMMMALPGTFPQEEAEKLKNAGLGVMHYLTGGTQRHNTTISFEDRQTDGFLTIQEIDELASTNSDFELLTFIPKEEAQTEQRDFSRLVIQRWMRIWTAQSRYSQWKPRFPCSLIHNSVTDIHETGSKLRTTAPTQVEARHGPGKPASHTALQQQQLLQLQQQIQTQLQIQQQQQQRLQQYHYHYQCQYQYQCQYPFEVQAGQQHASVQFSQSNSMLP